MTNLLNPVFVCGTFLITLMVLWIVRERQARRRRQLMLRMIAAVAAPAWIAGERRELTASAC